MMKLKTLVAAAALLASGGAFAKVASANDAATTTGGEMILSIYSASAKTSYAIDINLEYATFSSAALAANLPSATAQYTFDIVMNAGTDAAFATFLNSLNGATDVRYSFFGGDNSGVPAASRNMATTIKAGGNVASVTNGNIVDGMNQMANAYIDNTAGGVNTKMPSGRAGQGSAFFAEADGAGYYLKNNMNTLTGKFNIGNDNALGADADMYYFVRSGTSAGGNATESLLGVASLNQTAAAEYTFSFATPAIPEPETYGLALAGLAVVSALARRRAA